jgi:hypothetical protein
MRIVSLIILLSIISQSAGRLVILVNFKIHQAYIARLLCEKKDIPENTCKGNCQLNKKLNEQQETEKQLPPSVNLKELILYACKTTLSLQKIAILLLSQKLSEVLHWDLNKGYGSNVFHPPAK